LVLKAESPYFVSARKVLILGFTFLWCCWTDDWLRDYISGLKFDVNLEQNDSPGKGQMKTYHRVFFQSKLCKWQLGIRKYFRKSFSEIPQRSPVQSQNKIVKIFYTNSHKTFFICGWTSIMFAKTSKTRAVLLNAFQTWRNWIPFSIEVLLRLNTISMLTPIAWIGHFQSKYGNNVNTDRMSQYGVEVNLRAYVHCNVYTDRMDCTVYYLRLVPRPNTRWRSDVWYDQWRLWRRRRFLPASTSSIGRESRETWLHGNNSI
jgi:hypothetical protein